MTTVAVAADDRTTRENPWPGLRSYDEDEQDFFQGRPREATELLRLVKRDVLTVFFGISGIGKSSLLKAGLFPLLRREGLLPIRIRLGLSDPNPDLARDVRRSFEAEVESRGLSLDRSSDSPVGGSESLWEYFHRVRVWDQANRLTPVLVLDQFEEVFTLGGAGRAAAVVPAFIAEAADLIENQIPAEVRRRITHTRQPLPFAIDEQPIRLVLVLREDYLANLEGLASRIPSLNKRNRFRLLPMTTAQALDAVLIPGAGVITEPVARQIVDAISFTRRSVATPAATAETGGARDEDVEPFLLSLVCRELNARRLERQMPMISAELLQSSQGGVDQILGDFYERCFMDLTPSVRVFVEEELVGRTGFRQMVALDDLVEQPDIASAVDALVARRLLRIEEDRQGVARVELTHDVLTPIAIVHRNRRLLEEQTARALREQRAARRRQWISLMALMLVLAIGGMGLAVWQSFKQRAVARQLAQALDEAQVARRAAEQNRVKAEQQLESRQAAAAAAFTALQAAEKLLQANATGSQLARQQGRRLQDVAQTALAASNRIGNAPPATAAGPTASPGTAGVAGTPPNPTQSGQPTSSNTAAAARIVYIQVREKYDAEYAADQVAPLLRRAGFIVPPAEILATGPTGTEIRFFRPEDKAAAQQVAEMLRTYGPSLNEVPGYVANDPPHLEIWFQPGFMVP